jgi:hypothetical protein
MRDAVNRRRILLRVAALAVTLGVVLVAAYFVIGNSPRGHYNDGQGPLRSTNSRAVQSGAFPADARGPWTMGYRLCVQSEPVTVLTVAPGNTVGDGYRVLGVLARHITNTAVDTPIIGVNGYPPILPNAVHPDRLVPAADFVVTSSCSNKTTYDELLVGWDNAHTTQGGGWLGIDVTYRAAGHDHVVILPYEILICGPAAIRADPKACSS